MVEMIHSRKNSEKGEQRYDLFSSLLEANDDEDISGGDVKLSTSELLGRLNNIVQIPRSLLWHRW